MWLGARTIADYSWTWHKYVDFTTFSLRGLTLGRRELSDVCGPSLADHIRQRQAAS
jgi:hypothetical protein